MVNQRQWERNNRVIANDAIIYYAYLPAFFIYQDLTMNFKNEIKDKEVKIWAHKLDNENYVLKMSMGLAYLYSPFFAAAHAYSIVSGHRTNGYAPPYKLALMLSSLVYLLLGLLALRKFLLNFVKDLTVGITVLILVFGTNLAYYTIIEGQMSHVYSFFLFALFLLITKSWHTRQQFRTAILLGIVSGLISLIRPTNIVIILIFLFWNSFSVSDFKNNIYLFLQKYNHISIMILAGILVWLPQLFYWHNITGSWLYYSYNDESFFFTNPVFMKGLFSFRKGWLIYSPVMIFSLVGIIHLFRMKHKYAVPVSIFTFMNLWIIFSWWSWWYGGSFGQRAIIESYSLLALPLAILIQRISTFKVPLKIITIALLFMFSTLGLWNSIKYYYGSIHWQSMTSEAYFDSFLKTRPNKTFYEKLERPDYEGAKKGDR